MELIFNHVEAERLYNGDFALTLTIPRGNSAAVERLQSDFKPGEIWDASMQKHRSKRTLDANSYCWQLLGKLSEKLAETNPGTKTPTKEDIYRLHIRDVGVYEPLPIKNEAVERFCAVWAKKGTGWFVEIVDDSKLPGYKRVHAYYGSSTYDTKEMSRLIDNIVQDCKALGIETLPPHELERLKEEWR